MRLEAVRPGIYRLTLHAVELSSLIAAARLAIGDARNELPADARTQLQEAVRNYDSELARLERRASSE